jgi:hypothetical protein
MASIIKADNIQKVSDGTNIIKKCGSTITLGSCGATIALACGASQTGFGRTGTVDWCTTAKTAPFTGVSGKGYFVNTSCGAVTVTLPATPTAGDIISVADYASTFTTNNTTICGNGSKINGVCATAKLSTQGQSVTLVYVDGTQGWKNTMDSTSNVTGGSLIVATGGSITTCGDYKIHTFTSDGTFCVSAGGGPLGRADYIVVGGGGGGGQGCGASAWGGAGGGAGGFRESYCATVSGSYTASPLASSTSLTFNAGAYPVVVGAGGTGGANSPTGNGTQGTQGSNSSVSSITSTGGGFGGARSGRNPQPGTAGGQGGSGGSGGGKGADDNNPTATFGSGNTPPVNPSQGFPGGATVTGTAAGGGGGGAAGAGLNTAPNSNAGGTAGNGVSSAITGSPVARSGGGGGGGSNSLGSPTPGGTGGGGTGKSGGTALPGDAGTANTGGGGGGMSGGSPNGVSSGGAGGSGIVIIRYKYQ